MGIKITAYHYNTLCDTYGCAGMARVSLSMDDTPGSMKHNICNDCLEGIVTEAPLDMVLVRRDVYDYMQMKIAKAMEQIQPGSSHNSASVLPDTLPGDDDATWGPSIIAKLMDTDTGKKIMQHAIQRDVSAPVETATFPPDIEEFKDISIADVDATLLQRYNWQDLKKLARELKIENCNTIKRDVLEAEILKRL